MQRVGSRAQVMHGNAKMTGGGLKKKDLKYNKQGKIVSKKMSQRAKKEKRLQKAGYTIKKGQFGAVRSMRGGERYEFSVDWDQSHSNLKYANKINNNIITKGCGHYNLWATGNAILPSQGKYKIIYKVNKLDSNAPFDISVGVASRSANIQNQIGERPRGCYFLESYIHNQGSELIADGSLIRYDIPSKSKADSEIEVIVDQDASTVKFKIDGVPLLGGLIDNTVFASPSAAIYQHTGGADETFRPNTDLLEVKPEHKYDLTPAASVLYPGSALTLVAIEKIEAEEIEAEEIP